MGQLFGINGVSIMKKIANKALFITNMAILCTPMVVLADSGLESKYESSPSIVGALISTFFQCFAYLVKLLTKTPLDENFILCRNITVITCLIILYIVVTIHLFKLDHKNERKVLTKLSIGLILPIIYSLICFLLKIYTFIYLCIFIVILITFIITINIIIKKRFNKDCGKLKKIDKSYNEEEFINDSFEVFKEIQLLWSKSDLNKIKSLVSDDIYNDYVKKIDELKKQERKNIMDNIILKNNKIVDVIIDKDITIKCKMNITCIDYIIDKDNKVVKGKKDKPINYTYELSFNKKINDKKLVLIKKKLIKTKI